MAKWIYKIEDSFDEKDNGIISDIAATAAFLIALGAGMSWMMF